MIFFVTDAPDRQLISKTDGHVIVTQCPPTHNRRALCCKMAAELDAYLRSDKSWFCHFDDDNYVNVPKLMQTLSKFDSKRDFYLGKTSTNRPIDLLYKENGITEKISFRFATGGAGFCLSRSLALRMAPLAGYGKLIDIGEKIRLPDDVTVGFIIGICKFGMDNVT
uniref:Fringe n=1 Tax=Romanomermis culicivorax TaxID=13658 RepID=A0A915HN79_ROMCU